MSRSSSSMPRMRPCRRTLGDDPRKGRAAHVAREKATLAAFKSVKTTCVAAGVRERRRGGDPLDLRVHPSRRRRDADRGTGGTRNGAARRSRKKSISTTTRPRWAAGSSRCALRNRSRCLSVCLFGHPDGEISISFGRLDQPLEFFSQALNFEIETDRDDLDIFRVIALENGWSPLCTRFSTEVVRKSCICG